MLSKTSYSYSVTRELLSLTPPTARIVRDGDEQEVSLDEVQAGDIPRVGLQRAAQAMDELDTFAALRALIDD